MKSKICSLSVSFGGLVWIEKNRHGGYSVLADLHPDDSICVVTCTRDIRAAYRRAVVVAKCYAGEWRAR